MSRLYGTNNSLVLGNSDVRGTAVRFANDYKKRFFLFDSTERSNYSASSSNRVALKLPEAVLSVKTMNIEYFEMPNSVYNISAQLNNNILTVIQGGPPVTYTVVIPDGNYTAAAFLSTITTLVNAATGQIFTFTLDPLTGKVTINCAVSFTLDFTVDGSCYMELGFAATTYGPFNILGAPMILQLQGVTELFINMLDYESTLFSNSVAANFIVPIMVQFGDMIQYTSNSGIDQVNFFNNFNTKNDTFQIQMTDSKGRLIATNGANWKMLISFSFYD